MKSEMTTPIASVPLRCRLPASDGYSVSVILRRPCRERAGARSRRCSDQVSLGADGRAVH
jgi:hypothetical protein